MTKHFGNQHWRTNQIILSFETWQWRQHFLNQETLLLPLSVTIVVQPCAWISEDSTQVYSLKSLSGRTVHLLHHQFEPSVRTISLLRITISMRDFVTATVDHLKQQTDIGWRAVVPYSPPDSAVHVLGWYRPVLALKVDQRQGLLVDDVGLPARAQ